MLVLQKILVGLGRCFFGGVTNAVVKDGHRSIAANGVILVVGEDGRVFALGHRGDADA